MKTLKIIYALLAVLVLVVFVEGRVAIANNQPANPVYGLSNCLYHVGDFSGCVEAITIIHTDPELARCVLFQDSQSCLFNNDV